MTDTNDCGCDGSHGTCACDSKSTGAEGATCNPNLPGNIGQAKEADTWIAKLESQTTLTPEEAQLLVDAKEVRAALTSCVTPDSVLQKQVQTVRALVRALGGPPGPKPLAAMLLNSISRENQKAEKQVKLNRKAARGQRDRYERKAELQRHTAQAGLGEVEDFNLRLTLAELS